MGEIGKKAGLGVTPAAQSKTSANAQGNSAVGSTAIWDGPNKPTGPFIEGSSNGMNGISLLAKNAPAYKSGPITKIAGCESC
ncbi:unnamed protein product [marine sediment metagenome]|jgi:hypothetical protein|uniref:Uncharacterized protein n=1 Tax=marine sediment metagenome TaxID=412755 RepID=X1E876_9ZZZZ